MAPQAQRQVNAERAWERATRRPNLSVSQRRPLQPGSPSICLMALQGMSVIAIIPARGGSRGLPRKNVLPLNGQPLIYYSIDAGLSSKYVDAVLVTSDDQEILQVARSLGADTLQRPKELAADSTYMNDVLAHAFESVERQGRSFDLAILLQPTSPLRTSAHVDSAFELLNEYDSNSLISVYGLEKSLCKSFVVDHSGLECMHISEDVNDTMSYLAAVEGQLNYYSHHGGMEGRIAKGNTDSQPSTPLTPGGD